MVDRVHQSIPEMIAALAKLGVRLPVQAHPHDNCTIADADGLPICVIDHNREREDSAAAEITGLLTGLINTVLTPVATASSDASPIGQESVVIANEIGALLHGRNTVACYLALSMVLGAAAANAKRPDFDGMIKLVESGARDSFLRNLQEHGRG